MAPATGGKSQDVPRLRALAQGLSSSVDKRTMALLFETDRAPRSSPHRIQQMVTETVTPAEITLHISRHLLGHAVAMTRLERDCRWSRDNHVSGARDLRRRSAVPS